MGLAALWLVEATQRSERMTESQSSDEKQRRAVKE